MNRLKNILAIIGILSVFSLGSVCLWMIGEDSPETVQAQVVHPEIPDAFALAELIQENVNDFRIIEGIASHPREERDKLNAIIAEHEAEMEKYATGAEGLDYTLCHQYGVKYVRGVGEFGHFIEADECESF